MCYFFMVIKLLILKILLYDLLAVVNAARYEYGYHPSAEEYDNLLRETRRYWAHSFLKAERDKLLTKPAGKKPMPLENRAFYDSRYFVPKYQYEHNAVKKFHSLKNPLAKPLQNISSTLELNYNSAELPKPLFATTFNIQPTTAFNSKVSLPVKLNTTEIIVKPLVQPLAFNNPEAVKSNYSHESLPIYFTNPATGIIYAITELGKSKKNLTKTNGRIPIFITKEQYERDIFKLKSIYEQKCESLRVLTTTAPTPIIKLQKPLAHVIPINATQFTPGFTNNPKPLKKPAPVVIKTKLTIRDKKPASPRPVRKRKNKIKPKPKPKRKIKKQKPPGHKIVSTTLRPVFASQPEGPAIILGTRTLATKPYKSQENVPTQLEKPSFENIFSRVAQDQTSSETTTGSQETEQHRINKRSVEKQFENQNQQNYLNKRNAKQQHFDNKFQKVTTNFKDNKTESEGKEIHSFKKRKIVYEPKKNALKNFEKFNKNHTFEKQKNNTLPEDPEYRFHFNNENYRRDLKLSKNILKKDKLEFKNQNLPNPQFSSKLRNKIEKIPTKVQNFKLKKLKNYFKNPPNKNLLQTAASKDFKTSNIFLENLSQIINNFHNKNPIKLKNQKKKQTFTKNLISTGNKLLQNSKYFNHNKTLNKNNFEPTASFNNSNNKNYFDYKPLNDTNLNYLEHHVNKRSTAALTKLNATLPKFTKASNKSLDISNKQSLNQTQPTGQISSINSTAVARTSNSKQQGHVRKMAQRLRKRKRLAKIKRNHSNHSRTSLRTRKRILKKKKQIRKKPKENQDTEYYTFDLEGSYDEDEDDDDDDEDEEDIDDIDDDEEDDSEEAEYLNDGEEEEEIKDGTDLLAYEDDSFPTHTSEAGLSTEELNNSPSLSTFNSQNKDQDNSQSEMAEAVLKPPILDYDNNDKDIDFKTKATYIKKRFRRRPPQLEVYNDYDDDDDDDDDEEDNSIASNLSGFFRLIFYPVQMVMGSVIDSFAPKDNSEEENSPYIHYTSYHNTLKQQQPPSSEDYEDDEYETHDSSSSSFSNWFSSWFAFNRRNKKIGSTTVAPINLKKPTKTSTSWLPSWLSFGANDRISTDTASNEDYDEYDKWFASWFGEMKPKARKRTTTTTTTSTTTQLPHVPILTIVDPMKNPQNWIGILAHHIINHTSTSTANPLKDIWNRVTTTTTENPEIPKKISYDKYQIWRLKPQDESQFKALEEYKKSEDGIKLQWLKGPSLRGLTDVLVPPKMLVDFQASLTFELIDHEVLIFDVGKAITYEKTKEDFFFTTTQKPKKTQNNKRFGPLASMTWHKYYEYDDVIKYLETMRMRFPHLVELIHIGRSYEGRPLIVTKIESREAAAVNSAHYNAHQLNKLRHKKRIGLANAVFIEAGTHGMEWIGPATATWIINELLKIMKKNISDDQSFIRNTTWYILPILNPDGYVYSHEYDRFWKKSRSRHISRPSGIINSAMTWLQKKRAKEKVCFGVDLDRNWHYQWGRRGSSKSVCNEFYAGPTPFSEPETKALSEFLMDYRTQIKLFVSMQSYGQIISYPYKANTTYDSERLDELLDVAMVGTDNLRKKGSKSRYKIDSSNDLVENRSGCSDAFAAYEVGIPFSYTLQLADNGVHGYLLPSASIESTARDSFDIITGMLDYI